MSLSLNAEQRAAVRYLDGPLLVLAGAGSGKTRVITAKIAHLLEVGYDARRIAAITFTNKAAREMRERVTELLARRAAPGASSARGYTIATFHALGLRMVLEEARALGLKRGFSVLDVHDAEQIVADILRTTERGRVRATLAAHGF